MTVDDFKHLPPLPDGSSTRLRAQLFIIKLLVYHNRVDGMMAFVGVWWGSLTILFPYFWYRWPVTHQLSMMTFGVPTLLSWLLLLSGLIAYLAKRHHWLYIQFCCSLVAFLCWSLLTVTFVGVRPIFSPAVACYSAFAIAQLMTFLNHGIQRLEEMNDHASRDRPG